MHAAAPASEGAYHAAQQLMRSTSSDDSTYILFENQTDSPVKLYWLNYEGQEVAYRSVEPGKIHRQQTFVTHPWTFKLLEPVPGSKEDDVVVDNRRVVFPANNHEGSKRAVLKRPEMWQWTPENHKKRFPRKFVESTQAFLRAYHSQRHWCQGDGGGDGEWPSGGPSASLGVFPTEIVLRIIELSAPDIPYVLPVASSDTL
ncbi:VHL domain-containing protein [Chloropicon primus]|nr:hypothetical protein A3770_01p02330 [Chloropicon primus]UPQ96932.1 VHL domain-containing protein [Chloropicon primus]|eukprot:QDZ17715.1 hypothetical protein A3770_01p02330 [Chloropicon primus]